MREDFGAAALSLSDREYRQPADAFAAIRICGNRTGEDIAGLRTMGMCQTAVCSNDSARVL